VTDDVYRAPPAVFASAKRVDNSVRYSPVGPHATVAQHPPAFRSILNEDGRDAAGGESEAPSCFRDLNLDQILDSITVGREEYDLKPFFHAALTTVEAVQYRQDVIRDLEDRAALECIKTVADKMRLMRRKLAQANKLYYKLQKERWFLHAVETYCAAITELWESLSRLHLSSAGLVAFRDYVADYVKSERFLSLAAEAGKVTHDLEKVRYSIFIRDGSFRVQNYYSEQDYSADVAETFRRFQQGAAKDHSVEFKHSIEMNHIEAKVLEFVALLHPETFSGLADFCARNVEFTDPTLMRFDREVQFYLSYIEYMNRMWRAGLSFCYPNVSTDDKHIMADDTFDMALANKLIDAKSPVICNDFRLSGRERIFIVSGPNQGGKTTFARMFGQLHHFASIGCPVPGRKARLFLFDAIFTHFEREETVESLHGKLQADLIRIHDILGKATPKSLIIMNEIFTSTTLQDAVFLAREVIERIIGLDCLCVCVTFLDELASLGEKIVSMMSTVDADDPAIRTYKVIRRPTDGRCYAISLAEKYGLTYERLVSRLPQKCPGP